MRDAVWLDEAERQTRELTRALARELGVARRA
jgi:hypothetical protein